MQYDQTQTIAVLGDINVDLSFALPFFPREGDDTPATALRWGSGGAALNVAIALAQLGARARLIGRVGSDPAAHVALHAARTATLDLAALQIDPAVATGLCGVLVSPDGQRSFLSFRGANVRCEPTDPRLITSCALLVVSGYALLADPQRTTALRTIAIAHEQDIPVAIDLCLPAIRLARQLVIGLLSRLWLVSLNEDELRALLPGQSVDAAIDEIVAAGARHVALKRGPQGCRVAHAGARFDLLPPTVPVVDTNACGDAFTAGFAWALLHNADLPICATLGNTLGALTATRAGAADAIPTRAELLARLDPALHYLIV